jgi:competence protein ComEC
VSFLDVGQGDSILIESPSGNRVLIDGGKPGSILQPLAKALPLFARDLDVVIATHPDNDHVGGLPEVLTKYKVHSFIEPGSTGESSTYRELERLVKDTSIPRFLARRGMVVDMGDGVRLDVLFPDRDVSLVESNTSSVILRASYGSTTVMLTGDSPQVIERDVVRVYGNSLSSTVLKLGHHGSRTSSDELFVRAVNPQYAVVSAGAGNSYGHPHKEVIDLISRLGISVLETSKEGIIQCNSDGGSFVCD